MKKILYKIKRLVPKKLFKALQPSYHFLLNLAAACAYRFPSNDLIVIGVTGTTGKTTSTYLIAKTLEKTGGDATGDKFMAAAKGMAWTSPRGPVSIDPQTRDIVQTIYIRKVEKLNGKLQNMEFESVPNFKDPGKQ